jgi:hypothetical protein
VKINPNPNKKPTLLLQNHNNKKQSQPTIQNKEKKHKKQTFGVRESPKSSFQL